MRAAVRRAVAIGLVMVGIGSSLTAAHAEPATSSTTGETTCRELNIPVRLLIVPVSMYGKLCVPAGTVRSVQVLIPGGTYNSNYWDPPATPGVYSYREAMNKAGYATLTVDRVGTGRSTLPLGLTLTALFQADIMHQVVQGLRNGKYGPRFEKVIIGGHSLGAAISILEAANYGDVDGVLVTGLAHRLSPLDVVNGFLQFWPAMLDPQFAGKGLDPTFLTTRPGTRRIAFHEPALPLPSAVALDEQTKDAFALTEAADGIGVAIITPYSRLIRVPVFLALGGHDPLYCNPLALDCTSAATVHATESLYYSEQAQLQTYLLPGNYGHSFNFAPNAYEYHNAVAKWADAKVGR